METTVEWIVSDPKVMMGKPVVAGTRITVELILEKLAADYAGRFVLVRADSDRLREAAMRFRVQSIPAVFGVVDGEIGQCLAVELDAGDLQALHQLRIRQLVLAGRGIDARDPQPAELPLPLLAALVGVGHRADARARG